MEVVALMSRAGKQRYRRAAALVTCAAMLVAACASSPTGGTPAEPSQDRAAPLVWVPLGNSLVFDAPNVPEIATYRQMLIDELGVDVTARTEHLVGGESSQGMLDRLRTDATLRQDLSDADIVTILVPSDDLGEPMRTAGGAEGRDPADCGGSDQLQCMRDAVAVYEANTDAIFAELTSLVDPTRVLVRAQDSYLLYVPSMRAGGSLDTLRPFWEQTQAHVRQTAAAHGIPIAQVYADFMGPDGSRDPVAAGLVGPDEEHPTDVGAQRMAELLDALGYGPIRSSPST